MIVGMAMLLLLSDDTGLLRGLFDLERICHKHTVEETQVIFFNNENYRHVDPSTKRSKTNNGSRASKRPLASMWTTVRPSTAAGNNYDANVFGAPQRPAKNRNASRGRLTKWIPSQSTSHLALQTFTCTTRVRQPNILEPQEKLASLIRTTQSKH